MVFVLDLEALVTSFYFLMLWKSGAQVSDGGQGVDHFKWAFCRLTQYAHKL